MAPAGKQKSRKSGQIGILVVKRRRVFSHSAALARW